MNFGVKDWASPSPSSLPPTAEARPSAAGAPGERPHPTVGEGPPREGVHPRAQGHAPTVSILLRFPGWDWDYLTTPQNIFIIQPQTLLKKAAPDQMKVLSLYLHITAAVKLVGARDRPNDTEGTEGHVRAGVRDSPTVWRVPM